jgi:hypothetical protein
VLAAALAVAALGSCTSSAPTPGPTLTRTVTSTTTPPPTFVPKPAKSVAPLPPGASPAAGETEKPCPYIASTPADNPAVNLADIEGDHVYRTTVLTTLKPVGCRFYFYSGPYQAIADIVPRTFADAITAHNAMVLTARAGTQQIGKKGIAAGVDAILYRTKFFGPDGPRDWACAFSTGTVLVVVHTQRADTSLSALLIAQAVVARF